MQQQQTRLDWALVLVLVLELELVVWVGEEAQALFYLAQCQVVQPV